MSACVGVVVDADELAKAEAVLRDRLIEIVDWVYVGPHDPRYRTQRVSEAVERLWAQLETFRRVVREEVAFDRALAL